MLIWTNPKDLKHCLDIINNKLCDVLLVGTNKNLSILNDCILSLQEIKFLVKNKNNAKIVLALNNIYHENDIKKLSSFLKSLKNVAIDGIYFQDYAIKQICDEIGLKTNFIYSANTLNVNYGQFNFFKKNGIDEVVLSNEIFFNELKQIAKNKKTTRIQIYAQGNILLMHSKANLVTNFLKNKKMKNNDKVFFVKEKTRNIKHQIYEDRNGTFLFAGYNYSLLPIIDKIHALNVDSIFINGFLKSKKWINDTLKEYKAVLSALKNKTFSINKFKTAWDKKSYTSGFLGNVPFSLLDYKK